jgi:putative mycofactocin binding protein MftB
MPTQNFLPAVLAYFSTHYSRYFLTKTTQSAQLVHKSAFYLLAPALLIRDRHCTTHRSRMNRERRKKWKLKIRQSKQVMKSPAFWKKFRLKSSQSTASAGFTRMAAAGIGLHPACRVRQEGFGLLFYDSRGPRLLFAETGNLLTPDFFGIARCRDEFPAGLSDTQKKALQKFMTQLLEKGFLREQSIC